MRKKWTVTVRRIADRPDIEPKLYLLPSFGRVRGGTDICSGSITQALTTSSDFDKPGCEIVAINDVEWHNIPPNVRGTGLIYVNGGLAWWVDVAAGITLDDFELVII